MSRRFAAILVAFAAVAAAAVWGPKPAARPPGADQLAIPPASSSTPGSAPPSTSPTVAGSMTLAATRIDVSTSAGGAIVLSVRLTARVHVVDAVAIAGNGASPGLRFTLLAPHSVASVGTFRAPPALDLAAGSTTDYELGFDFRGLSLVPAAGTPIAAAGFGPPAPGIWLLVLDLTSTAGHRTHLETFVTIEGPA